MKHTKDNQHETIMIEIIAWLFIMGIIYILAKSFY